MNNTTPSNTNKQRKWYKNPLYTAGIVVAITAIIGGGAWWYITAQQKSPEPLSPEASRLQTTKQIGELKTMYAARIGTIIWDGVDTFGEPTGGMRLMVDDTEMDFEGKTPKPEKLKSSNQRYKVEYYEYDGQKVFKSYQIVSN